MSTSASTASCITWSCPRSSERGPSGAGPCARTGRRGAHAGGEELSEGRARGRVLAPALALARAAEALVREAWSSPRGGREVGCLLPHHVVVSAFISERRRGILRGRPVSRGAGCARSGACCYITWPCPAVIGPPALALAPSPAPAAPSAVALEPASRGRVRIHLIAARKAPAPALARAASAVTLEPPGASHLRGQARDWRVLARFDSVVYSIL